MTERQLTAIDNEGCGTMQSVGGYTPGAGTLAKRERVAADKRAQTKAKAAARAKQKRKRKATKATRRAQR